MRYYLAYGSNLNVAQMRRRCPGARIVGTARIKGYRLLFKGSLTGSYLTIEEKADSVVPVAVWSVTKRDEAALDRYEGFPSFYYKKDMTVRVGRRDVDAFVYIMHEDRPLGIPSDFYMQTCMEGYKTFGFSPVHLERAVNVSKEARHEVSKMRTAI